MTQSKKNVLISLEGRYIDGIVSRKKKVELRNRRMNLSRGDSIWMYSKQPRGCIVVRATVKAVTEDNPESLWRDFREECGLSKEEFFAYFDGAEFGCAISLFKIKKLPAPLTLERIRSKDKNFHPPQFSKYLDGVPLLSFLESCLAET